MNFVDSHCHLDRLDLDQNHTLDTYLKDAADVGVEHCLCVAIDLEVYPAMRELIAPFPQVSVSVGVHPCDTEGQEPTLDRLIELGSDPAVVAIGETGLDYHYGKGDELANQQARFCTHIQAARAVDKPLIVHTRDAREDTITLLREEGADSCRGVMHCFTETWDMARQALDLGFYISFSGIVTFRNAEELRDVARQVPQDRILIETDSPYLAPVPKRGKPNQPAYVRHVAEKIAEVRGDSVEDVARYTTENFYQLFRRARRDPGVA